ncbi:hypothetical protein RYX56_08365 [Alkalihalophilus lindianensis]|uniref:Uncharacterized protein n=1 Tax=Alkalihalophilus lindianensis TaxID=1630542 RepID=A0ABU3X916_9BACI|nr:MULTISPECIES: hypothetical protein [Bacillaceae]MDV2684382.1 hypothetical protein [Alkalihalophilus lindianensis]
MKNLEANLNNINIKEGSIEEGMVNKAEKTSVPVVNLDLTILGGSRPRIY